MKIAVEPHSGFDAPDWMSYPERCLMTELYQHRWRSQGAPALAVAVVCLFAAVLPARVQGDAIIFSQPTDGGFATNLYSLIAPEESRTIRDRLQERQLSARQLINPHAITDSEFGPPPTRRTVMPTKEQRDKLDKEKNWAFSLLEELDKKDPTVAEALKFADPEGLGKSKRADTAEERYVARLTAGSGATTKGDGVSKPEFGENATSDNQESAAASQRSAAGSVLRSLLESGGTKGGLSRLGQDDSLLGRNPDSSFAAPSSQSSRMSDFRALLEGRSPLSSALDQPPPSAARITALPGLPGTGGSPAAASKFGLSGGASGSSWTRLPSSGLTPLPSLAAPRSAFSQAPAPMVPPSPLRMSGPPAPAFPPRR